MVRWDLEIDSPINVMAGLLVGLLGFFILERLVLWRHCHHPDCDAHKASGYLILVGDAFHNNRDRDHPRHYSEVLCDSAGHCPSFQV